MREVVDAILEIPSNDQIGDVIHAAAALAIDKDDAESCPMLIAVLEKMAQRAGFAPMSEEAQA
jgi:hypothetical protein